TGDLLGLTRAKEVLLGALNSDGLREAFDAPRFVRLGLALGGEEAVAGAGSDLQRAALTSAWARLEGDLDDLDLQATLYRAIFAVGFAQAGDMSRARGLAHDVEELRPLFDPPGRALLRLYLARLECLGVDDPGPIWERAVAEATQGLGSREQSAVDFARRRSLWLAEGATPPRRLDSGVEARLALLAADADDIPAALRAPGLGYDYLIADLVEGALALADATGREALMAESRDAALIALEQLDIPGHRATVIGATLRTAALLEDEAAVHGLIELFMRQIPEMESIAEILRAVEPAMAALRRIGLGSEAERFLLALRDVARRGHREAVKVAVFVADGFRLLGDVPAAERTLAEIEQAIYTPGLDPIARFEGASTLFGTLRAWSVSAREMAADKALESLDLFRDNFTTQRYFRLHRFLLVERVVDALSDTRAHGGGRLRLWLEAEEQAVRRRIVADWRSAR
ncbi:MAG: hypothetical protein KC549_00695, partial [Myxococcales bacterium]|nr:hypothetical protein [Myxococcales bacterium]